MLDSGRAIQLEGGDWVKKYSLVLSAPRMEEILSNNSKEENMALWGDCNREVTRGINNSNQSGENGKHGGEGPGQWQHAELRHCAYVLLHLRGVGDKQQGGEEGGEGHWGHQ